MLEHAMTEYKKRVSDVRGGSKARPRDPNERRAQFEAYADIFKEPYPASLTVTNWFIAAPGREIPVRIYSQKSDEKQPTIVYFHGGGYMSGSLYTHDTWLRTWRPAPAPRSSPYIIAGRRRTPIRCGR